jgi:hypothetical protein
MCLQKEITLLKTLKEKNYYILKITDEKEHDPEPYPHLLPDP